MKAMGAPDTETKMSRRSPERIAATPPQSPFKSTASYLSQPKGVCHPVNGQHTRSWRYLCGHVEITQACGSGAAERNDAPYAERVFAQRALLPRLRGARGGRHGHVA